MFKRQLSILIVLSCFWEASWARAISLESIDSYAVNSIAPSKFMVETLKTHAVQGRVESPILPVIPPVGGVPNTSKVTPPVSSIATPGLVPSPIDVPVPTLVPEKVTPMLALVDNERIIREKISDHTLEAHLFEEDIPVYTWNVWAFGTRNGFSAERETSLNVYREQRFNKQVEIIRKLFTDTPGAILCLQEVSQSGFDFITEVSTALRDMNMGVEYNKKTGTESFGQLILYKKDKYTPVRASNTKDTARYSAGTAAPYQFRDDLNVQDDRVLKVYFQETTGKRREVSVVNVHLKWYLDTDLRKPTLFASLIENLITYAPGMRSPKPAVIITGDFNYDLRGYRPLKPEVKEVKAVGSSLSWGGTESKINVTDGFVIIKP